MASATSAFPAAPLQHQPGRNAHGRCQHHDVQHLQPVAARQGLLDRGRFVAAADGSLLRRRHRRDADRESSARHSAAARSIAAALPTGLKRPRGLTARILLTHLRACSTGTWMKASFGHAFGDGAAVAIHAPVVTDPQHNRAQPQRLLALHRRTCRSRRTFLRR